MKTSCLHLEPFMPPSLYLSGKNEQTGVREGWRVVRRNRDSFFEVIKFWVENRLMLELLPPVLAQQYLEFTKPQNIEKFLAMAAPPTTVSEVAILQAR